MKFPTTFPANCPPKDSGSCSGPVFRIVEKAEVQDQDFKSYEELKIPGGTPCRRVAVSVYPRLADAFHRQGLSPSLGNFVAEGTFVSTAGKQKLTNPESNHVAWWPAEGFDRASMFGQRHPCPPPEEQT